LLKFLNSQYVQLANIPDDKLQWPFTTLTVTIYLTICV